MGEPQRFPRNLAVRATGMGKCRVFLGKVKEIPDPLYFDSRQFLALSPNDQANLKNTSTCSQLAPYRLLCLPAILTDSYEQFCGIEIQGGKQSSDSGILFRLPLTGYPT